LTSAVFFAVLTGFKLILSYLTYSLLVEFFVQLQGFLLLCDVTVYVSNA